MSNTETLGFIIHDVARLLRKRFERHARGSGLTRSQWHVLAILARNEGVSQRALARLLDIEPTTLGRIVDGLQAIGLIKRSKDRDDRRVWLLHLTPAAYPKLSLMRRLSDVTREEALADISEADKRKLFETLQTLRCRLADVCMMPAKRKESLGQSPRNLKAPEQRSGSFRRV
jgi:MarR family transcriptional regulator, transcriptional regulator for hemolysin